MKPVSGDFDAQIVLHRHFYTARITAYIALSTVKMVTDFDFPITKKLSKKELSTLANVFQRRGGMFFTPTKNIPSEFVKSGVLDVVLPRSIPNWVSTINNQAYRIPRLWVDELQRLTGSIRWTPMPLAKVTIIAYDDMSPFDMSIGGKALLDALKSTTYGRPDGKLLYYFGAIEDDSPSHIELRQVVDLTNSKSSGCTRLIVEPATSVKSGGFKRIA